MFPWLNSNLNSNRRYLQMNITIRTGVYILQNTMARGGNGAGEKMKNEAVRNKMKKKEKRGKEKEEKEKGEREFFVNIWHNSVDHCILT